MAEPNLKDRLTALLVETKLISPEKLEEVLKIQREKKERLSDVLVRLGYISKDKLLEVLSVETGFPVIRLSRYKILPNALSVIPKKLAEVHLIMPVSKLNDTLTVAMTDPRNVTALDDIRRITSLEIRRVIATDKEIREAIEQYYGENVSQALQDVMKRIDSDESLQIQESDAASQAAGGSVADILRLTEEEPVVKLTNSIMSEAVKRRSSDIFIEPEEAALRVRYRVDGLLQEALSTTKSMHTGVVSRIKVMSNLDIAEHRIPQDGRFKLNIKDKIVDFRVSVLPTYFGEKVVLRVLDKSGALLDLDRLGFEPAPLNALKKSALHPHGMIVVCGPTGAGKTTTLYSMLKLLDKPDQNIVTVEDPVEFQIDGINQVPINAEANLTFAAALRSILRQDPDIIMVGEIRDAETADVAVKAALTGHLVLSTLHATTAVGAITRFINMGVEPFLIASSLLLAASQRLVRKVCPSCREFYEPSADLIRVLGIGREDLESAPKILFARGRGCSACANKGYAGRAVLIEAITITSAVKNLILKGAQEYEVKRLARSEGMKTLRDDGIAKILRGITSPEEVMRVTVRDQDEPK